MSKKSLSKINLRSEKTEYLTDDEIYNFFVSSENMEEITKIKNTFLVGHKGSGKSIVLKYLSIPIQLIRFSKKTSIEFDEKSIGILIQCKVGKFGGFREPTDEKVLDKDWVNAFTHIFNLCIIQIFLLGIKDISEGKKDITINEINCFSDEIIRIFRFDMSVITFEKLYTFIDDEISLIQEEYQQNKLRNNNRFYTDHRILNEIRISFQKCFNKYKNIEPVFLLDEYNELSNGQKRIVNEMINMRHPVFKMSSIPHGYIRDRIFPGQIDIDQDYGIVYLGNKPLTPKSEQIQSLQKFMSEVWKKRVENLSINSNIEKLLESPKSFKNTVKKRTQADVKRENEYNYCGFSNYVILSEGNPKTFLDLIQDTVNKAIERKINLKDGKISTSVQLDVILEYSKQRRKEVVQSDTLLGRSLQRLIEWFGKYLKLKSDTTKEQYREVAVKDPELLSELASNTIELGLRSSWLIQKDLGRVSKNERIRLETFTLKNILIPSFEIPLSAHQIWEITSNEINNLLEGRQAEIESKLEEKSSNIERGIEVKPKQLSLEIHDYLSDILELIKKNELILFIGSGLSSHAGIISAQDLAKTIAGEMKITEDFPLEKISEYFINENDHDKLYDLMEKEIMNVKNVDLQLHKKLIELGITTIITTNWDDLLEVVFKEKDLKSQVIVSQEEIMKYNEKDPAIFKIHGDFNHKALMVAAESQYDDYSNTHDFMLTRLKAILQNKSILFIGYGLHDKNFINIRNMVGKELGKLRDSYAIFLESYEKETEVLKKKKIKVIVSSFVDIINSLWSSK